MRYNRWKSTHTRRCSERVATTTSYHHHHHHHHDATGKSIIFHGTRTQFAPYQAAPPLDLVTPSGVILRQSFSVCLPVCLFVRFFGARVLLPTRAMPCFTRQTNTHHTTPHHTTPHPLALWSARAWKAG